MGWPYFYWHLKCRGQGESFWPRLGLAPLPEPPGGFPRIWLHGASVGEILAAVPLAQELKALLPQAGLIVSTATETGQRVARQHFAALGAAVCYFPLDVPWAVHRYLHHFRPHIFVGLESEIWPGFLTTARRLGVRLTLLNARMSDKSFRRYVKYRQYATYLIEQYDLIAAGSQQDFDRFRQLGVPPAKLHLAGNLKYDRLLRGRDESRAEAYYRIVQADGPPPEAPVFLAASTHSGEDAIILDAYEQLRVPYPALLLLLAPRHPERALDLARLAAARGLSVHLWSRLQSGQETRANPVIIIDTIGDLFQLYPLADIAFVGGSLVPHGGQNILEAAAWGRVPLYGPHLENFRWAKEILEQAITGIEVQDAPSLIRAAGDLLAHPEIRNHLGALAQAALTPHQGAAHRQAELVADLWQKKFT